SEGARIEEVLGVVAGSSLRRARALGYATGRGSLRRMADTPLDTGLFRRVMGRFATGVTVITAEAEGGVRGMTANAFMSGSLSPPLCIISVAKKAKLHGVMTAGHVFGVSMLAQGQEAISRHFAGQAPADPEV